MSLISENVVKELIIWARENEDKHIFPEADQEVSSYYIDRTSEETYLHEYAIDTLADLKTALETYSGLPVNSLIFKQMLFEISRQRRAQSQKRDNMKKEIKSDKSNEDEAVVKDDKKRLPEHIYVF